MSGEADACARELCWILDPVGISLAGGADPDVMIDQLRRLARDTAATLAALGERLLDERLVPPAGAK